MTDQELADTLAWVTEQLSTIRFGEVGLRFIVHDRVVKRTEKTVTTKEEPSTSTGKLAHTNAIRGKEGIAHARGTTSRPPT